MKSLGVLCSQKNILVFLYLTIFLLPLSAFGLYAALIPAILLSAGHMISEKKTDLKSGPLKWAAAGFLPEAKEVRSNIYAVIRGDKDDSFLL